MSLKGVRQDTQSTVHLQEIQFCSMVKFFIFPEDFNTQNLASHYSSLLSPTYRSITANLTYAGLNGDHHSAHVGIHLV